MDDQITDEDEDDENGALIQNMTTDDNDNDINQRIVPRLPLEQINNPSVHEKSEPSVTEDDYIKNPLFVKLSAAKHKPVWEDQYEEESVCIDE
jgi:hypothetical protein